MDIEFRAASARLTCFSMCATSPANAKIRSGEDPLPLAISS
jgi:hypothetical protein